MTSNQIVKYALSLADESTNNFINNDELELFLNGGYSRLYKAIANLPEDYYTMFYSDTIKEHGEINLPQEFYLLKNIEVNNESNLLGSYRNQLQKATEYKIDLYEYRIIANRIMFNKQMAGKNIEIYYIPSPAWIPLSDNPWLDSVTSGAFDYLAYYIASEIAFKRSSNNTPSLRAKYMELQNSFIDTFNRDQFRSQRVIEVEEW